MTSFWSKAAAEAANHNSGDIIRPGGADDSAQQPIRRDPPPPPPPPPTPAATADSLHRRLAEELEYARRMLTAVGDELASDCIVVARHAAALQSFDFLGQMLGHLATVVGSSDPHGAVELVGMADLKARLKRRSLT